MHSRSVIALLALLALPTIASAQAAPTAHQGDMLRDANSARLANVNTVNKDDSVGIIYEGHYITVPASTLSIVNSKLTTSLTKRQVSALH